MEEVEEVRTVVDCPHYREHGQRPGRMVNTISYTCEAKGRHISPERDCKECPENGGDGERWERG